MKRVAFVVTLLVLGVIPTASPQSTTSFAFITFDVPTAQFPGAIHTENAGINNLGVSVGDYCLAADASQCHGYKRSAFGVFTPIEVPGAFETDPSGINNSGVIVGQYFIPGRHCFVLDASGVPQTIDAQFPGVNVVGTGCRAINDNGQIVGIYVTQDPSGPRHRHGFLLSGGMIVSGFMTFPTKTFTSIDSPVFGTTDTFARGINNVGQIVGRYVVNGVNHGFLQVLSDVTTFTTIDFPGAAETVAGGINNSVFNRPSQIVGTYRDVNNILFGFIVPTSQVPGPPPPANFKQIVLPGPGQNVGLVQNFADLPFSTSFVAAINDAGQISGEYWGVEPTTTLGINVVHGFVTAPKQEFEVTGSAFITSANPTTVTGTFEGDPIGAGSFNLDVSGTPTAPIIPWGPFVFCARFQLPLVLMTATGDKISVDLLVTVCQTALPGTLVPSSGVISGLYRITGGTGPFGGASGTGFIRGTFGFPANPSPTTPGTFTVTLEGTIIH